MLLSRVGRYFKQAPGLVQKFAWMEGFECVTGRSDSDWAGDVTSRKSTSGGVAIVGLHVGKHWSATRNVVVHSSVGAALYALLKCSCQCLRIVSLVFEFGIELAAVLKFDASVAFVAAQRRGFGKLRHIRVQLLRLPERVREGDLQLTQVHGKVNFVDLLADIVVADDIRKYSDIFDFEAKRDRAEKAFTTASVQQVICRVFGIEQDSWSHDSQCFIRLHKTPRRMLFTLFSKRRIAPLSAALLALE